MNKSECEDLRDLLKLKAEKHSLFYRTYIPAASNSFSDDCELLANADSTSNQSQLATEGENQNLDYEFNTTKNRTEEDVSNKIADDTKIQHFDEIIEMNAMKSSSLDDCCDVNDNNNNKTKTNTRKTTSCTINIDERIGNDKDVTVNNLNNDNKRRMTLTVADIPLRPALLPLAEPTSLPICESPTNRYPPNNNLNHTIIPEPIDLFSPSIRSKMILEEQVIPIPSNDLTIKLKDANSYTTPANCDENDISLPKVQIKYVRTPSVVVSDYSDDVMYGITLEEIEYLRNKNNYRRCSYDDAYSDLSASSSCSNLNYCCESIGNSYDNLFDEPQTPERKISNGSQTSTISNEDIIINGLEELKPQPKKKVSH